MKKVSKDIQHAKGLKPVGLCLFFAKATQKQLTGEKNRPIPTPVVLLTRDLYVKIMVLVALVPFYIFKTIE